MAGVEEGGEDSMVSGGDGALGRVRREGIAGDTELVDTVEPDTAESLGCDRVQVGMGK